MANNYLSIWDRIAGLNQLLVQCIAEKLSARDTAEKLSMLAGQCMSRNSVIGKAKRSGLRFPSKPGWPKGANKNAVRKPRKQFSNPNWTYRPQTPPEPVPEPPRYVGSLSITFDELEPAMCRFPEGEKPYLYCGQPADGSWCTHHHKIVFVGRSNFQVKKRENYQWKDVV